MNQPAYMKIYSILKQQIRDGEYKAGDLLPPEHAIEDIFDVSRTTVRRALDLLARDGYVDAKQGRGTEVLDYSIVQRLNALTSISETLTRKGYTVSTRGMHIDSIPANARVARALKLREGETVVRIQRVQFANDLPICISTNYLIESIAPGIERCQNQFTSLYAFLEKNYHIILSSATENISAGVADFSESQILQVPLGSPLLITKRTTYSNNVPVEYAESKLLGHKYEFSIHMEGRS